MTFAKIMFKMLKTKINHSALWQRNYRQDKLRMRSTYLKSKRIHLKSELANERYKGLSRSDESLSRQTLNRIEEEKSKL